MFFRALSTDEEVQFRAWTRSNYRPGEAIDGAWHPAVRDEARKMNVEQANATNIGEEEQADG